MTLTLVFDNNRLDPDMPTGTRLRTAPRLRAGWGFAAWLEYGGHTVLFDTGADGSVLLKNMAALGLDPQAIEIVVLSHIHGDHTGGLTALLAANRGVTVYMPQAFPARFKKQLRANSMAVVEVRGPLEILPGLWSTGQMGASIVEQALVARTAQGLVVITGCAHPGVDVMVARAKEIGMDGVQLVVGGFHLGGASRQRIKGIIAAFVEMGVQQVAPCHCTGDRARALFREAYGEQYHAAGVGWQWQSGRVTVQPAGQDLLGHKACPEPVGGTSRRR